MLNSILEKAEKDQQTKKIDTQYFILDFYKKGTCHITFKDDELLKRFNIFGSQHKAWLPPCYGRKAYSKMTSEEKRVIDEFEGEKSYEKVYSNPDLFFFKGSDVLRIEKCS